jgi:isocitrate lyase
MRTDSQIGTDKVTGGLSARQAGGLADGSGRWEGIARPYSVLEVERLRAAFGANEVLARRGAQRLWDLLSTEDYVAARPAGSGESAVRQVRAGLKTLYLPGEDGGTEPESSRSWESGPGGVVGHVRGVGRALLEEQEKELRERTPRSTVNWLVPMVVQAGSAGCGRERAFELTKSLIEAGAAGVQFEAPLSSSGPGAESAEPVMAGLVGARLAADVMNVPTLLFVRIAGTQKAEPMEEVVRRALLLAPYADVLWLGGSGPDLDGARMFAEAMNETFPGKLLALDCHPSFDLQRGLDAHTLFGFQRELAELGYRFQYVRLGGFPSLSMDRSGTGRRPSGWAAPSGPKRAHPY